MTSLPSGSWVTVIESIPKSTMSELEAFDRAAALGTSVTVVDTDRVAGLRRGYWAAAVVNQSARSHATAACREVGRDVGPTCYPREIG